MVKRLFSYVAVFVVAVLFATTFKPLDAVEGYAQGSGCRAFSETGKTVCGRFLQYWQEHGGLAQQGLPLSNEFVESSDLNGKEYTVQYFERAVFEKHPENQPPYDVLLSQLGTFQFKRKYPGGDPSGNTPPAPPAPTQAPSGASQELSGSSDQVTAPFTLRKGLAVFHSASTGGDSNFIIELVDAQGQYVHLVANEIGAADVSSAMQIRADGSYMLKVTADGDWRVSYSQPTAPYQTPPASQQFSGRQHQATALFSLKAGAARFHAVSSSGSSNFIVELLDKDGAYAGLVANKIGAADVSTIVNIRSNGVFILDVDFDGDWVVSVSQ